MYLSYHINNINNISTSLEPKTNANSLLYLEVDPEFGHWKAKEAPSCFLLSPPLCLSLVWWVCCSRSWSWRLLASLYQLLGQGLYQDSVKCRVLGGNSCLQGVIRAKLLHEVFMYTSEHPLDVQVLRICLCPGESGCSTELRQDLSDELLTCFCQICWLLGGSI